MHPVIFKLGPFCVYSYGVMVAAAFLTATFLMQTLAGRFSISKSAVADLMIVVLVSGVAGARLLHVAVNPGYYLENPAEIFMISHGGLAFYGGVFGGMAGGIIFLKARGIDIWKAGDLIAPFIALGQAIGRVGCYLNGCCYGIPSPSFIPGVVFPAEDVVRIPTQIISAFLLVCLYAALRFLLEKNIFKGNLFLVYLILYSGMRFFVEFLRGDVARYGPGLTASQAISVFMFFAALAVLRKRVSHGKI